MSSFPHLQSVLGTNRKSPVFTVSQHTETKRYHVSYGMELFDVVPSDREDLRFKLMVGHLANVGVSLSALHDAFGVEGLNALQSAPGAARPAGVPVARARNPGGSKRVKPAREAPAWPGSKGLYYPTNGSMP
jgi:hypothetical protein